MSTFVVYSYQFSPAFNSLTPSLFAEDIIDSNEVWLNKQGHFGDIFKRQLTYTYRGAKFDSELIYNENEIIVFRLANNKHIVQEAGFVPKKLEHKPSCLVLIDNRHDVQNIYTRGMSILFQSRMSFVIFLPRHIIPACKSLGL